MSEVQGVLRGQGTSDPHFLAILREEGLGADCSSLPKLILSERVGIRGEDIMFTSNNTLAHEYAAAKKLGAVINLDDITHIDYLKEKRRPARDSLLSLQPGSGA